jgi:hypothetical protein
MRAEGSNFLEILSKHVESAANNHVVFESPGTAYEWQTWHRLLNDSASRFSRDEVYAVDTSGESVHLACAFG